MYNTTKLCRLNIVKIYTGRTRKQHKVLEILYRSSNCMHPFDVGNGKTFFKYKFLSMARTKHQF